MTIAVLGAGAFGTALAVSLASKGPVTLWARSDDHAQEIRATGRNDRRLPGVDLPETLLVSADIHEIDRCDVVLLAVPMQQLRKLLVQHGSVLAGKVLVSCCKGVELGTGLGPAAVISETVPDARSALLTGPSFAADIARGLPTALTLACTDAGLGKDLQHRLSTGNLRLYRTTDVIGAELGGALKNVIAIGCGACIGEGMGDSARAALLTRGFAEMRRLAVHFGARPETLAGLSGLGDLALTCTSDLSRNYRFGLALGRQDPFDPDITVEGVATARALRDLAETEALDLPIATTVADLSDGRYSVAEALRALLNRPLKEE